MTVVQVPDLNPDVVGYFTVIDQATNKVEFCVARGRVADLNLLEVALDQVAEEAQLLVGGHGARECLVAIPQVCRKPYRMTGGTPVWPLTMNDINSAVWCVFGARIGARMNPPNMNL